MRGEFLDLQGTRLYYYAAGSRGAGEPVLFLHGFPTSGHLWSDVVPLMPPGHRIIVLDLLGYGRSDRPSGQPVDVLAHANRVVQLLDVLHVERACVVGHGLGGGIAQSLAVRHSHRVSRLCLVDSVAFDRWPTFAALVVRATLSLIRFLPPDVITAVLRWNLQRGYADPAHAAHALELYLRPFSGPDGREALMAHVQAFGGSETSDVAAQLPTLRAPTAVVWGQHDPVMPLSVGRRLQKAIGGATLQVVPGVRHFTPQEAPRQVADTIAELLTR